jgi:hypothetical protein
MNLSKTYTDEEYGDLLRRLSLLDNKWNQIKNLINNEAEWVDWPDGDGAQVVRASELRRILDA